MSEPATDGNQNGLAQLLDDAEKLKTWAQGSPVWCGDWSNPGRISWFRTYRSEGREAIEIGLFTDGLGPRSDFYFLQRKEIPKQITGQTNGSEEELVENYNQDPGGNIQKLYEEVLKSVYASPSPA